MCDNIVKKDYKYFLLHLLWVCESGQCKLIWGMLEGYPIELRPDDYEEITLSKIGKKRYYYKRVRINIEEYEKVLYDITNKGIFSLFESDKTVAVSGNLIAKPSEDGYLLSVDDGVNRAPFVAKIWGQCRFRTYFSVEAISYIEEILNKKNLVQAINAQLMWDISLYPELIGSFSVVLPNPIYRKVNMKLIPGRDESVLVNVLLRDSRKLSELNFYYREKTAYGISMNEVTISQENINSFIIETKGKIDRFALVVKSKEYGLLEWQNMAGFIRNISFGMYIANKRSEIISPKNGEDIIVTKYEAVDTNNKKITYNNENVLDKMFSMGEQIRTKKDKAREMGQHIFRDKNESKEYMRELLRKARKEIIIEDPYFSINELYEYVHTRYHDDVHVTLITSGKHLSRDRINNVPAYEYLSGELREHKDEMENVEIMVMKGKPLFHDRFIFIDDECYLSGNSLNDIGARYSCIIKIPNPMEIKELISEMCNDSDKVEQFTDWYNDKKAGEQHE